jgi:formate hydrogenlyase transcriptional activator
LTRCRRIYGVPYKASYATGALPLAPILYLSPLLLVRILGFARAELSQQHPYLRAPVPTEQGFEEILGRSKALRAVLRQVRTVAPTDSTVLICGETGTGKELVARAIHNLSRRRSKTFVKLNCAAIPAGLLESELFGHERGAFTGASAQRLGRFELANHGTAFLDEIGDMPLELQPKLLRELLEQEFERPGSVRTIRTDARLVTATNRDLAVMVDDRAFRADLYYRLDIFPIRIPSLRERSEDIPLLVRHFVQQYAARSYRPMGRFWKFRSMPCRPRACRQKSVTRTRPCKKPSERTSWPQ